MPRCNEHDQYTSKFGNVDYKQQTEILKRQIVVCIGIRRSGVIRVSNTSL